MLDTAVFVDGASLEPPPGLLDRLRQLDGYTWDESRESFRSSYDIWHISGTKRIGGSTNSSLSSRLLENASPRHDISGNSKRQQDEGSRKEESVPVGRPAVEIVARISVHTLREERAYYICKTLVSAVDPNGYHIIRPLEILRLASQDSNNGPMVVCIFEYAGPNYLPRVVDYGLGWYNLRGEDLHASPNEDFVAEPITLQMFLDFAIGAAECIEVLHGQQIVHGEVRGDTFHWNIETGKIRLIHLGAGLRTFEQGLTSTGWSKMSREHGARTKLSYMSPEQTGRMPIEPDSRTDIFSLGLLFWTILVQKPAFEGETPMDVIQAVLGKRLPLVSNVRLDIPEVISRIIQKATAKSVSDRYHSISGLRHDLAEVRTLLGTGDFAQLQNLEIGTKDVSPSFILPEVLVGRAVEHDAVVKVIDHAFRLRQASKVQDKRSMNHLSRLSECQFAGFDMAFTAGDASFEDDDGSSADGGTNSISDVVSGDPKTYQATTSQLRPRADSHQNSVDSDRKSPDKRISANMDSLSAADSMNGESGGPRSSSDGVRSLIIHRSQGSVRIKGRCEVITIAGAAGLGKSRLIHSVQIEARRRGYFASSKFDQAEKTPFGPVLKLLSSLFQQVFSESNMDPVFHQILKQHVTSTWPVLHKVLNLPEFLLGPSIGFNSSLGPEAKSGDSSPGHAGPIQDFLRAGSSMKSLPLMNTFLDVLRIFARYKFICFCLDDLHFADEESLELIASIISTRIKMVIIVTFRPEDVSSEKMRAIINPLDDEGMENHKVGDVGVTRVALKPLNQDDIMEYVAATIRRRKPDILPLCSIIQSRTGGNPFYIREMLDACHRKKCIWYDYRESGWLFDPGRIFKEFKIENFDETMHADFVTSRLNALPAASRTILAWASMLGASFSFQLIQRLLSGEFAPGKQDRQSDDRNTSQLSLSEQDSVKGLQAAIQACIVVPTHDDDVFCFAHDRYLQAAITLRNGDENWMHFVMTQMLVKYYSNDDKYQNVIASSICESISTIKRSVAQRRYFRKLLLTYAHTACENGLRSTASKLYGSCIELLQDDMWNNETDDVYYEETLHVHTAAAECYLYRGQYQDAKRLLLSVSSNAMTAIDKAPSWILQSRLFAQEGDSTSAFQALKVCLVALDVEVDNNPTFQKCDTEFKRLCQEIQSIDADTLIKKPIAEESTLAAVGAVLVECSTAAFWSDTLTFYQMTLIMVNTYLSSNSFPQAGMGFLQLALIAITRHNMIKFANDCGNIALALIERWKDPYTIGRGGTIYSTFVGHIQHHLQASINQLEGALEFAIQAGDRPSTILNFGLAGNLKFFAAENLADLESFCTYGCQDIPHWESDTPGGTMIITIRQVCRALQGKTITGNSQGVMSDENHNSHRYKSWLVNTVKNYDRPLMLYESIEIAPLFLYGHYSSAVALGNSCLKKINAMWSARNSRFLMFFHALSLAGSIWIRVEEQLNPVYRNQSPQLSSDIKGRSFEAGLQEEIEGLAMLMKYFKKRIEQWQVVTDVNYLAWSKLLAAQISEMEDDYTNALRLYEEAIDHASTQHFTFEEALANNLLGGCLLRLGSRRLAKTAFLEAITLYRQFGATGVASHIENQHHLILRESRSSVLTTEVGIQTDPDETLGMIDPHITGFGQHDSQIPESLLGTRIGMWQDSSAPVNTGAGPALHMLDLTSILESSQVISSVLQVEELLKTMCEIILQNCKGVASLAAIVIEEDQSLGWVIAASGNEEGAEAHNPPLSLKESALIAESVVNYCTRFRETVFLPDLIQDPRFSNVNDTWVVRNPSSKSVVAIPICHGEGKPLLGVLYLEGQPNAFTNRSLEVLHLLVNQIGISYSNALTLKEVERVSAINKSMVDVQKKALSEAITAKAEALHNAQLAEEAAKAKTTFLANISHELRTPLNGVIGNSELLLDSQLQKQQAEMADSIRVSADLLLSLINDILDFSKIEAHKMQLHITAFNTNEMIQEIVRSIPIDHKKLKDVCIIQDIHLPQSLVYGDPVRLHQILLNLASNSKKFTEKGSITIGAKLEWETRAAVHLTFWIKDTGIGVPAQQQHKLFKPFSQADASTARKYGGSGLGLSICKSLIESMGGTIKLESTENVGTTVSFSLTLPKAKPEASAGETQKEPGSIDTASSTEELVKIGHTNLSEVPHSQLRACIAEDNPINQKIALQFLQKLKFEVVDVYDNGLLAVEGIQRKAQEGQPYHVVLMDVQMPVLDGYEATKLLRNDSSDVVRGILVIALTASAVQGDKEKCLASGMNDYLAKPVRLAVLKKKFALYMQVE